MWAEETSFLVYYENTKNYSSKWFSWKICTFQIQLEKDINGTF